MTGERVVASLVSNLIVRARPGRRAGDGASEIDPTVVSFGIKFRLN